ncbi:flagellar hook-length control protein FliK [Alkalibacillus aidingensis]|uniref:flagellar hook-length control protein FliK n=1 Tax=Alkalibacillus aidingensis TaxID=2747607 RepID=UPI0016616CA2|nr:flagellar hook-length control protein FliK [Alkalibacillus aidingensis]
MKGMAALLPMMTQNQLTQTATKTGNDSSEGGMFQAVLAGIFEDSSMPLSENQDLSSEELMQLIEQIVEQFLQAENETDFELTEEMDDSQLGQLIEALHQLFETESYDGLELASISDEETLEALGDFLLNFLEEQGELTEEVDLAATKDLAQFLGSSQSSDFAKLANQVPKAEQTVSRIIAMILNQQQNNGFQQTDSKWQQLLQKVSQQLASQQPQLNQLSTKSDQEVSMIKNALRQILGQPSSSKGLTDNQLQMNFRPGDSMDQLGTMSKLEQYTIHLSRTGGGQQTSSSNQQQIIEQLQKIIQSSQFGRSNGTNQLTIQLKPANLGNMTLQFTQIDGQMAVKISVMSHAAKEMLENNLNQLRHMFSPSQVVIERQVDQSNTDFTKQQNASDKQEEEQSGENEHQQQDQQQQGEASDESLSSFKDYLFQEEV